MEHKNVKNAPNESTIKYVTLIEFDLIHYKVTFKTTYHIATVMVGEVVGMNTNFISSHRN